MARAKAEEAARLLEADLGPLGEALAKTTYGIIGVKTWIYQGDILPDRGQAKA